MLESLVLWDFQKHKKINIRFDKNVTTFVGSSDSGKSSIIRGLQWIMCNSLSGSSFIHRGSDYSRGQINIDGHTIRRKKGKTTNKYWLNRCCYKALGRGIVPSQIFSILNVNDLNIQNQHDSPFWLSRSAGQVSRELNAIIDLSVIDSTLAHVASELNDTRSSVRVSEKRLQEVKEQDTALSYVVDLDNVLCQAECFDKQAGQIQSRKSNLVLLVSRMEELQQIVTNADKLVGMASRAFQTCQEALELSKRRSALKVLLDRLALAKRAVEPIPSINALVTAAAYVSDFSLISSGLSDLVCEYEKQEQAQCQANESVSRAETALKKLVGQKCPLCQRSNTKMS